jgi:CDGSH-type Zn-finger protein
VIYIADEDKKVAFCTCKQTKKPPFCDGSHKDL